MSNVLNFRGNKITPEEILADLAESIKAGEVQHLLVVTMSPKTVTNAAMTTSPAHICVYMNQYQRLIIERLMSEVGMI